MEKFVEPNVKLDSLDLDEIIDHLIKSNGDKCQLSSECIISLCDMACDELGKEPMLLDLSVPINICGDIHGQFVDLLRIFKTCGHPPKSSYLFLGDYVDRGKRSMETICLLLAYKLRYPDKMFLLRGNHECASINRIYGFYDELKRRYKIKLWRYFVDCFNNMPVAAVISDRVFCCHGGLSPELKSLQQIRDLPRPTDVPVTGLMCDLLWADLNHTSKGWGQNERGVSVTYSGQIVSDFLKQHDFDLMCRAHEVVEDGYEFFGYRNLITLFSAPNYCGQMNNAGAVLRISKNLICSLVIIEPNVVQQQKVSRSAACTNLKVKY